MIKQLSPLPKFLSNRYKNWKSTTFSNNLNKFKNLASLGQKPNSMIISCCDSRVHVTSIFEADEGEFFIHRNIANLVPPYSNDSEHHGTLAAIEYAIKELKIRHFIILGHTGCGGIKGGYDLHSKNKNLDYLFINKWLNILWPAFNNISKDTSIENQITELEEESIKQSLKNFFTFPNIEKEVKEKRLFVHGLIHDIGSGNLKYLNPISEKFEDI